MERIWSPLIAQVSTRFAHEDVRYSEIRPNYVSWKYASTQSQEDESSGLYQVLGFGPRILQRNTSNHMPSLVPPLSSSRQIRKEASLQEMVQETGPVGQEEEGDSRVVSGKELADK